MPKRPKYDPADDEPKVGDIWRREELIAAGDYIWRHYLLLEAYDDSPGSFTALRLDDGETMPIYFNFELDEWRWVA